ncbi:MBL fold metallo-hydrolase [Salinirubellus salinus]|uniref:MBL fold metallo-hydrolase n=1 Tax=Salinirubellus salinus TaxID=1364945 RepID=A0A9E7R369_9EURY|nr:MBL fold metallo-hydrolase [Salinirubellus salinus]UWM54792.1 MBL fold metallo-hydrolase [Salinirubellus salinus]
MRLTRVSCSVATRAPTGQTHAYVLGDEDALLVDPAAREAGLDDLESVAHVAVTHHHPDHVGAVAHYAAEHDATVWCRVGRGAAFEAATGVAPDRTFAEGTVVETGDGPVTVVDTPGHAPEHVGFSFAGDTGREELLVGDLAVATGSVVVGHPTGDVRTYLASLRRLWARAPAILHPAHGPTIEDPRATCVRLIDHRREREAKVLAAVEGGAETVAEITDAAYEKDLTGVADLAHATVRAHVEKLRVERKVRWDGERASPV